MRMPMGSSWWPAVMAAVVCGFCSVAGRGASTSLTSQSFRDTVTVSRSDGPTVKGAITDCTPELLTVLPSPKPTPAAPAARLGARSGKVSAGDPTAGAAAKPPDPPKPDPVQVPWPAVRHVSNGLTYRSVLYAWEAAHAAQVCPECHGERTVMCPVCKGTNHDPAAAADCKTCHGELLVPCKTRGETDGTVACPNGCLEAGVGNWAKGPHDQLVRKFPLGGGKAETFSQDHIGDVIVVDPKAHTATDAGKCPICGGTSKVLDALCHGTGKLPCPECLIRKAAACPNHCDGGRVVCPTCHGTGLAAAKG